MPIDPLLFKRAARPDLIKMAVVSNRQTNSDVIEAKANAIVNQVLNQGKDLSRAREVEEERKRQEEETPVDSMFFYKPPREESGLYDPNFKLDESQLAAIDMLVTRQYGCLIGAAGSGKTTCQRFFLQKMIYGDEELGVQPMQLKMLSGKQGPNIALCAFTGIATQVIKQNMPSWLHPACKTLHSLLEYGPVSQEVEAKDGSGLKEVTIFMPYRHAGNKLDHEIIIIDEASMVGLDLWHQLLDACRPGTKIFLIGDLNQLPPVFSQSMFAYALSSWPVAELTHIHRQKEPAANKIIEVAHAILQGRQFELDDASKNHNWRVIGMELADDPQKAGVQIVAIANNIRDKRVHESVDPDRPLIYDPYRDRIITAGNGYDENNATSAIQQFHINQALARLIEPPSEINPVIVIDAGLGPKKFAVGHRVMATRNEPPDVKDRVTNGMVGRILEITENPLWKGNRLLVGPEDQVAANRAKSLEKFFEETFKSEEEKFDSLMEGADDFTFERRNKDEEDRAQAASHVVKVQFANEAIREFRSKAAVYSLQLAYASTCHKTQGSQMDTAIIVCHHAVKKQLNREWFYTAVTRATKRVILLYTKHGIRNALAKQRIFGRTLAEKIQRYKALQEEGMGPLKVRVRLTIEENA